MPIAQLGAVNISALSVPQALVQIVPPQFLFAGVSSNVCGLVGTTVWGPVNLPVVFGNYAEFAANFGPTNNRKYDMGGHVILAAAQGAAYFCGVRVTDGTDVAATGTIGTTGLTITARYTGSLGNSVKVTIATGTKTGTWKIVISCPGLATEIFDNLGSGLTANALWVALAAAINSGSSTVRPASNIIIATAGASTSAPVAGTTPLTTGTDGATTITGTVLLGQDALPRTGMYALRNQGVSQFTLCDLDDTTAWSTELTFALDIAAEVIQSGPKSDTISNAATVFSGTGIDSPWFKPIFGDWIIWIDTINNIPQRITSPAAVAVGLLGNLSPQNSLLNKPIGSIVGTQSDILGKTYSYADYQALAAARLDLVAQDLTISNSFIFRLGINSSSNPVTEDDSYTRVTNFLALSLNIIGAKYLGQNQTSTQRRQAKVAMQEFLALAQTNGIIGTADDSQAYQVVLDNTNNTQATVALGYEFAYVKAIYLGIVRFFIINLEGGASVTISETPPGQ